MSVSLDDLVVEADAAITAQGSAPSTLMQYRWGWSRFKRFCSDDGSTVFSEQDSAAFLRFVAAEHEAGRYRDWKARLLRKAVLVLVEVAATGSYQWKLSRQVHRNGALDAAFRPTQEQFEAWLEDQRLAVATRDLYATVSRTVLAWLPEHGVTDVRGLTGADVSAVVVFLGERYRPGSMRTVLTAVRVLTRFLEDAVGCAGLSRAVPALPSRRTGSVRVLPADRVEELIRMPDPGTPAGRRDRALLLLAARTGLRPRDLVGLRLGDIDWRQARITITQHKTGTVLTVPLLADVGDAIADYLLHGRPTGVTDEHVFLRSQAPFTALSPSNDLHHVAARAFARTREGAPPGTGRGFRVLRASLATRMLEDEVPLPVISGALGHRGIDSAKHYLAGDEQRMRECCLDFVGIEPVAVRS